MLNHLARVAVSVVCDNARLAEYDLRALDDKTAACCISSEAGKSFSIQYENRLQCSLLICIHFDGTLVGSFYSAPGSDNIVSGAQISRTLERPFIFSQPPPTDNHATQSTKHPKTSHWGCIEVDVHRYAAVWECEEFCTNNADPAGESSMTAGTQHIRLRDAVISKPRPQIQGHVLDPIGHPYARFIFYHNSRDVLRGAEDPSLSRPLRAGISGPPMAVNVVHNEESMKTRGRDDVTKSNDEDRSSEAVKRVRYSSPDRSDDARMHLLKVNTVAVRCVGLQKEIRDDAKTIRFSVNGDKMAIGYLTREA